MSKKVYYFIVFLSLGIISIYALLRIFLGNVDIPRYNTEIIKALVALLILSYELSVARNPYRIICLVLVPLAVIGFLFRILHWPGSFMFILSLLIINSTLIIRLVIDKLFADLLILLFPLIYTVALFCHFSRFGCAGPMWVIVIAAMCIASITAGVKAFGSQAHIKH